MLTPTRSLMLSLILILMLIMLGVPLGGGARAYAQQQVQLDSLREGGGHGPAPVPAQDVMRSPPTRFPLQFQAEDVRLFVEADSVKVEGLYRLRRRAPGMIPALFYPYPVDSLLGGARTVLLRVSTPEGEWAPLRWQESSRPPGARWLLPFFRGEVLDVHTIYRQALRGSYARYIVTTTKVWREPLEHARFEIHLPPGVEPVRFSYPFVRQEDEHGDYYLYETDDFWPDEDIVVEWQP
jgi:hypothetical protein